MMKNEVCDLICFGKNLNNGQILSLFPAIDAGIPAKQIKNSIENLGKVSLSNSHLPKWKKVGKNQSSILVFENHFDIITLIPKF